MTECAIFLHVVAQKLQNVQIWNLACKCSTAQGWCLCIHYFTFFILLAIHSDIKSQLVKEGHYFNSSLLVALAVSKLMAVGGKFNSTLGIVDWSKSWHPVLGLVTSLTSKFTHQILTRYLSSWLRYYCFWFLKTRHHYRYIRILLLVSILSFCHHRHMTCHSALAYQTSSESENLLQIYYVITISNMHSCNRTTLLAFSLFHPSFVLLFVYFVKIRRKLALLCQIHQNFAIFSTLCVH